MVRKKILFIINGLYGSNEITDNVINSLLLSEHYQAEVKITFAEKDAVSFAREATTQNYFLIVACGGDGTVNEIVNGILSKPNHKTKLAILPLGTGNDFMRHRANFQNGTQFITSLENSSFEKIDIGEIHHKDKIHFFINIADVGFGGSVINTLNKQRKIFGGKLSYELAILKTFFRFRKPHLKIKSAGFNYEGDVFMLAFCNGTTFGNGIIINPFAKPDDNLLHLTLLGNVNVIDYLRYLPSLKKGKAIQHSQVRYFDGKQFEIELISGTALVEADGEYICDSSFTVQIGSRQIELLSLNE